MRLRIEPVSPVYIGSGEKIGKFEMLIRGDKTYVLDFDKLMSKNNFVEYFVANIDIILEPSKKRHSPGKNIQSSKNERRRLYKICLSNHHG